jgi:hypothetical protein
MTLVVVLLTLANLWPRTHIIPSCAPITRPNNTETEINFGFPFSFYKTTKVPKGYIDCIVPTVSQPQAPPDVFLIQLLVMNLTVAGIVIMLVKILHEKISGQK